MGTGMHSILRSFCLNTDWNYAVFWKLKHRSRMVLTWEEAYYDNCERQDHSENKCLSETQGKLHSGPCSHDLLGLAVARMSYHVYSLGEGSVGQVAVSGKYQWIFADKPVSSSHSSFEFSDGWQSQFSAGIKTIVVVAVAPHGVVQLGSLNTVCEDVKMVVHIKDAFFALPDSFTRQTTSSPMQCSMKSTVVLSDLPPKSLDSKFLPDCISSADKSTDKESPDHWLPVSTSYNTTVCAGNTKSLRLNSSVTDLDRQKQVIVESLNERMCEVTKDLVVDSENYLYSHSSSSVTHNISLYNIVVPGENCRVDLPYVSLESLEPSLCNTIKLDSIDTCQNGVLKIPESSNMRLQKDMEKLECQTDESSSLDTSNIFLKFSAGCELQEALGPAFLKGSLYFDYESEKSEGGACVGMLEGMSSGQLTSDSGSENLLEAVVGNFCSSDVKSEQSLCQPEQSLLTSQKMAETSCQSQHTIYSTGHSTNHPSLVEGDIRHCLNTLELCGSLSPQGLSSACLSSHSEQLDRNSEPAKNNKKRSRPGESSRPRPRDRQLIQDRIKELRELVPNGSKCSIDSLLERTIKHMLFLQSIAKHADKLKNCAESKLHHKGTGMPGSSNYEQGSSWAVEVGSHLKVCSIIVENLNQKGQILVEMLCEECSHFLEIAEAIKSLNLTILKGITEVYGEKTWMCFVVEGQNNRIMHRMDILWSLMKILQP